MHEYAFIHIPKCAGQSFNHAAKKQLPDKIKFFGHGVLFKDIPKNLKQLIIFRDPFDRFASAFFWTKEGWPFKDPNEFIYHLTGDNPFNRRLALGLLGVNCGQTVNGKRIYTNWIFHPQVDWIDNPHKVLMFDTLQRDIDELGLNLRLPHLNKSTRKTFEYDKKSVSFLKKVYKYDFHFYDKCRG